MPRRVARRGVRPDWRRADQVPPPPHNTVRCALRSTRALSDADWCLQPDGVPPLHVFRYHIHLEGGGWCFHDPPALQEDVQCWYRAYGPAIESNTPPAYLGSSAPLAANFTTAPPRGFGYLTSADPTENPSLHNYSFAYIHYCDGASYTGDADQPAFHPDHPGQPIYYRGRRVLDATIRHLLEHEGLGIATEVVVSGTSAGGLGVYLNIDRIAEQVQAVTPDARVRGLASAGYFLELATPPPPPPPPPSPSTKKKEKKRGYWCDSVYKVCSGCSQYTKPLCTPAQLNATFAECFSACDPGPHPQGYSCYWAGPRGMTCEKEVVPFEYPNITDCEKNCKNPPTHAAQLPAQPPAPAPPVAPYSQQIGQLAREQNSTPALDPTCVAAAVARGRSGTDCFFAQNAASFIRTPTFAMQSRFDTWQLEHIPHISTKNRSGVEWYASRIEAAMAPLVAAASAGAAKGTPNHAVWLSACLTHGLSIVPFWIHAAQSGTLEWEAFESWRSGALDGPSHSRTWIDCKEVGCNPTC